MNIIWTAYVAFKGGTCDRIRIKIGRHPKEIVNVEPVFFLRKRELDFLSDFNTSHEHFNKPLLKESSPSRVIFMWVWRG